MLKSQYLASPALLAIAFAGPAAFAQTVEAPVVASPPPVVATVPDAAPPPVVRTITDTVAPAALEQVRAEQASRPAAKPAAPRPAPTRPAVTAAPAAPAASVPTIDSDVSTASPVSETAVPATETAPPPVADEVAPLPPTELTDGSGQDWMIYGGLAAALGLAGVGAAFAASRRRRLVDEDDRGAAYSAPVRTAAPQPMAPHYAEPGRTRIIEPAAVPATPGSVAAVPVAAAAPVAAPVIAKGPPAEPIRDPLFARRQAVPEGVTDPLFTRPQAPPPPVTDPLFSQKIAVPPVTDPLFANSPEYAGQPRRSAPITPREREEARTRDVEFAL